LPQNSGFSKFETPGVAKTQHRVLTGGTKPCTNGL